MQRKQCTIAAFTRFMFLLIIGISTAGTFISAQELRVLTEQYPPFSYEQDGIQGGLAIEIVEAVLDLAGIQSEISFDNWSRIYRQASRNPDVLIFSIGRTEEREDLFHWVGVVAPFDMYMYKLSGRTDIHAEKLNDLRPYKIGVVRGDMRDQYFRSSGGWNIQRYRNSMDMLRDLMRGRIDVIPVQELSFAYLAEYMEYSIYDFSPFLFVPELSNEGLYMALSQGTAEQSIQNIQDAYNELAESGKLQAMIESYTSPSRSYE